jgi:hypothetical protein
VQTSGAAKGIRVHNQDEISALSGSKVISYLKLYPACSCEFQTVPLGMPLPEGSFTLNSINYAGRAPPYSSSAGLPGTYYSDVKQFKFYNMEGNTETLIEEMGSFVDILVCRYNASNIVLNQITTLIQNVSQIIGILSARAPLTDQCLIDVETEAVEHNDTMIMTRDFSDIFECKDLLEFMPDFQLGTDEINADYQTCVSSLITTTQATTTVDPELPTTTTQATTTVDPELPTTTASICGK